MNIFDAISILLRKFLPFIKTSFNFGNLSLKRKEILSHRVKLLSLLGVALCASVISAKSIDKESIKVNFSAYKAQNKVAVNGTFNDVVFKFGKKNESIASTLNNAQATIDPSNISVGENLQDKNIKEFFIKKWAKPEIKVTLKNIIEGNNVGTILANVRMNGKTQKVPMQYTIKNGILKASGVLDLSEFKLDEARENLIKNTSDAIEGLIWSEVQVGFEAKVVD